MFVQYWESQSSVIQRSKLQVSVIQSSKSTSLATREEPPLLPDHLIQLLASWQCLAPTDVLIKILQLLWAT